MALKILQINLGRGREAQDLMFNNASQKGIDIILVSEQYAKIEGKPWFQDVLGKAAICVINPRITIDKIEENNENFVVIYTNGIRIYSCYYSPNIETDDFLRRLGHIEENLKRETNPVLVGGDFNSKSSEWRSKITDNRGVAVSEMFASLDLIVLNRGTSPTFRRGESNSIIDITAASINIAGRTNK